MEGVPRIPMMGFPMRRSADTPHFRTKLKSFISSHYNEDPDSYSNEIHELESLRASAVHVSKDYSGCSTLKKYFCQLNFLKSRFPLNEGGSCAVSFSWYDVFSEHVHGWSDVDFEMSCILYNIGALHSELGALDNRQTADGMKTSCTHFQCAAWAFNHLRHNYQKFFTPDVSPDMLNILYNICLAQAQECILEKSLIDNRKSTITAKVALQIVEYYSTALRIIDTMCKDAAQYSDKLIKSVKTWRKLVELKVHYYGCIAYLYRGMQAEDQGKWGERVTMYKASAEKLNTCIKFAKNLEKTDPVHDTIHFTLDVVGGKVAIAEKENEFIYHEKVPELDAVMADVKGVSLVKGIQFKFDDPQVAGPDIFGRLVPMEAHEASSLYSEEKAKILRTYSKKIEEKNESLDRFVLPLQLDQLELSETDRIPQELIDCCAALSVNQDAVKRLSELMANLSSLFHDVEANLEEIQDHLADQEKKEAEYQEVVGKRPPNNIINEISREFQKYQSAQAVAAESNKTLHEAMVTHVANLNILMKPLDEVMKHIPKYDEMERNEEALERMKKLSGKVGEMRKQREMLESQLRDSILNDDITKSLVVKKDEDLETVFKEELQKHDKVTQLLDQNLLAQDNIIRALTEANAEYAETRRATVELKKKRDAVIQSFISSYEAYDELVSKCNKGIEFYTKLNTNVGKLLQRTRSVCKVQNEERDINMERIIRKAQAPVIPSVPPTSTPGYSNMMPGQYPGYPSSSAVTPSSVSAFATSATIPPASPASLPPSRPSSGGHLKLKDYLAMKKEGLNPSAMLQNNMAQPPPASNSQPNGATQPYPGVGNAYYNQPQQPNYNAGNTANHQVPTPNAPSAATPAAAGYYPQGSSPQPQINPSAMITQTPTPPPPSAPSPQQYPIQPPPNPPQQLYQPPPQQQLQPHQQQMPHNPSPSMMSTYTPNQPGYNNTGYTSTYSNPVYSSRHHPYGGNAPMDKVNTFSSSYGIPLSYSGPSGYQQTINSTAPTSVPPAQYQSTVPSVAPSQTQAQPASYYSPVYHPTANTITNATYSTGTTATPSQMASPSQPLQHNVPVPAQQPPSQIPIQQPPPQAPVQQPQQVPSQLQQPPQVPAPIQQPSVEPSAVAPVAGTQQQPQPPPSNMDTYNPANSFLAQYVRQSQGYLSSTSSQAAVNSSGGTFPSSGNYTTGNVGGYSQQPQQQVVNSQSTAYQQQPTMASYGQGQQQAGQYASYGQQQWQQPSHQVPQQQPSQQQHQQQQPGGYPASYPQQQQQPPQSGYPNQQNYQQYGQQQPQQHQGYYNAPGVTPPQPQQNNGYPHPQQQPVPQSHVPPPTKPVANSNLDLLSDIDFNVSVAPLAPVVMPGTGNTAAVEHNSEPAEISAISKPQGHENNAAPLGSFDPLWT